MSTSELIKSFGRKVTLRRRAPSDYVRGKHVPGAVTESEFVASVQPTSGRDVQLLAEGDRHKQSLKLYTETELTTGAPGQEEDRVVSRGIEYRVRNVLWHQEGLYSHYKAIIVREAE